MNNIIKVVEKKLNTCFDRFEQTCEWPYAQGGRCIDYTVAKGSETYEIQVHTPDDQDFMVFRSVNGNASGDPEMTFNLSLIDSKNALPGNQPDKALSIA